MMRMNNVARTLWANSSAEREWRGKMSILTQRAYDLEWYSVRDGMRRANITSAEDADLIIRRARDMKLKYRILGEYKTYKGFSHTLEKARPGDKTITYFAVARTDEDTELMAKGFTEFDNVLQGELLGYPKCCSDAFDNRWRVLQHHDHVWDAAVDTIGQDNTNIELHDIGLTNQFFRYCGPRIIHHLPCRFDCSESIKVAKEYEYLEKENFGDNQLYSFMSMPFHASMYRGIIEVTSTIFRMVSATDFTKEKYIFTVT